MCIKCFASGILEIAQMQLCLCIDNFRTRASLSKKFPLGSLYCLLWSFAKYPVLVTRVCEVTSEQQKLSNYIKTSDYVYVKHDATSKLNPASCLLGSTNRIRMICKRVQTNYSLLRDVLQADYVKYIKTDNPQCLSSIT